MNIFHFGWSYSVVEKLISKHQVTPDEVEQVFSGKTVVRSHRGVYLALGRSFASRYLLVAFNKTGKQSIKILTARDMTKSEKRLYLQGK